MIGTFDYMPPGGTLMAECQRATFCRSVSRPVRTARGWRRSGDADSRVDARRDAIDDPRSPAQPCAHEQTARSCAASRRKARAPDGRRRLAHLLDVLIEEQTARAWKRSARRSRPSITRPIACPSSARRRCRRSTSSAGEQTVIDRGAYRSPPANTLPGIAPPKSRAECAMATAAFGDAVGLRFASADTEAAYRSWHRDMAVPLMRVGMYRRAVPWIMTASPSCAALAQVGIANPALRGSCCFQFHTDRRGAERFFISRFACLRHAFSASRRWFPASRT